MMPVKREDILALVRRYYQENLRPTPFSPGQRIGYAGRVFDEHEVENLVDAALDFWLTAGRYADRFEAEFASFLGLPHCALVNSGSSANLLAAAALTSPALGARRLSRGDEVITVAAAFPTTVAPIVQAGAVPVFIDLSLPGYNADPDQLAAALSTRTKAVFLAHTLGNPFNLERIKNFCARHGLWLVEDNCDALGSKYTIAGETRRTGAWGDLGTSSFYPPHHITMGEGGAVCCRDPELARIVESLRDWGRDCRCKPGRDNACGRRFSGQYGSLPPGYDHKYVYAHLGYNLKATDLQAAVGCAQLEKLPDFIAARRKNWQLLRKALENLNDAFVLPEPEPQSEPSWFGFMLTVRPEAPFSRNEIVSHLEAKNIQTRNLFAGNLTRHPCFAALRPGADYRIAAPLDNTDLVMNRSFWIGVYPGMDEARLEYMAAAIASFVRK